MPQRPTTLATILLLLAAAGCGDGRSGSSADRLGPIAHEEVVLDPFSRKDLFEIRAQAADAPVRLDSVQPSKALDVNGGARRAVLAAPPSELVFRCEPEPGWILTFAAGMDRRAVDAGTDGMSFHVRIDGVTRWERILGAPQKDGQKTWHEGEIDLSPWVGRTIEVSLATHPGPREDATGDLGGWSQVKIVRRREVPRRVGGPDRPNVLVLLVDTLRADGFGCYGNLRDTSPTVDRLAAEGLRFDRAYSACSWTAPSVASLFTGLVPSAHGVITDERSFLVDGLPTLAERLASAGVTTGGFVANPLITQGRNFDQGFETFVHDRLAAAGELHEQLLAWLRPRRGTQWFAYVHAMEPHDPYLPDPEWVRRYDPGYDGPFDGSADAINRVRGQIWRGPGKDEDRLRFTRRDAAHLRALYDGEIAGWDRELDALLRTLSSEGFLENTVVVVTSDHGEEFLEHGSLKHGHSLYEELVRVPLVFWGPGLIPVQEVDVPVPMIALHRTVCEMMDVPVGDRVLGPSLIATAVGAKPGPVLLETEHGQRKGRRGSKGRYGIRGIVSGDWKLLWVGELHIGELFELDLDPGEQQSIFRTNPSPLQRQKRKGRKAPTEAIHPVAAKLFRRMTFLMRRAQKHQPWNVAPLDEDTEAALRALGYLR